MSAAGATSVRLFPEWRSIEPKQGEWKWEQADALVAAAAANKIEINAVLMGSVPWSQSKIHAFPMDDLPAWQKFVGASVERYKGKIRYWEVWNEGNGGFNDDKHTTADYARLAVATYEAAKKANPDAQVGLTVASYDPAYLQQVIPAINKEGRPNSFDYLCLHPYEIADGLADPDGEIPFLWMSRLLRDSLKIYAPEKANCEIWLTEVGRRIGDHGGRKVSEEQAASDLVKLYVMALAQGITCTQWFEAQDPIGEDQGFGLIGRDGKERATYKALQTLRKVLGPKPKYIGWIKQIPARPYLFLFEGAEEKLVLVGWLPKGLKGDPEQAVKVSSKVEVIHSVTGKMQVRGIQDVELFEAPQFLVGMPSGFRTTAELNFQHVFPWGGDFSFAKSVGIALGDNPMTKGIHQVAQYSTPTIKFPDGSTGILLRGDQAANFYVHPSFANLEQREYYVRVTVRRIAPGNVGFNINYEVADSQGKTPYKNRGIWYSVGAGNDWQTHTWHITDACFAKMWGYDFSFRPEQSVPFVIGKVEVSLEPFK
jgi:hypothetical protein